MFFKKYGMFKIIKTDLFFLFILAAVLFSLYGKCINFDFSYGDDNSLVKRNINYIADIKNIPQLFADPCFVSYNSKYYRPVLMLSFVPEALLFRDNPAVYHFTDLILFILALYLIYIFVCRTEKKNIIFRFLILLFAVHPVFTSCAVWIPARNDTLLIIFTMLSFILFDMWLENRKIKYLIFYIFSFIAAIFTKETAVVLPLLYFIFIYCFFDFRIAKKQMILSVLSVVSVLLLYFIMRNNALSADLSVLNIFSDLQMYIKNIFTGFTVYTNLFLIPLNVPVIIYRPVFNIADFILPVISVLLFVFICIKFKCHIKKIFFAGAWIILLLLPTFVQNDYSSLVHRLLIAAPGILIILFFLIKNIAEKYYVFKKYGYVFFAVLFCFYAYSGFCQADKFKDRFVYAYSHYSDAPECWLSFYTLGCAYNELGEYDKAEYFFNSAYKMNPVPYIYVEIAESERLKGNTDNAEKIFLDLTEKGVTSSKCFYGLSRIYAEKKDLKNALEFAQKACFYAPCNVEYTEHLAYIYSVSGFYKQAEDIFKELLRLDRNNHKYCYNLSLICNELGDKKEALNYCRKAVKLSNKDERYTELLKKLNA